VKSDKAYPVSKVEYLIGSCLALLIMLLCFAAAAPVAAQEATAEPPVYVVQPGDTLFSIAQRFDSTVEAIVAANDIADPSLIRVGQRLIIPTARPELVPVLESAPQSRVHPVRPGEALPSLAFQYGTTFWTLRDENDLHQLGLLWPGQKLQIPPPTAPTTGTLRFPEISASPAQVVQGRSMLIRVRSEGALDLGGSFLGQDLLFVDEGEGFYWALVGVDALTPPGGYPVALRATEARSGDLLAMREVFSVTAGNFTTYNVAVPADRQGLLEPQLSQAERELVNAVFAGVSEERLWAAPIGYPLQGELRVTAPFGQRRSYGGGPVSSYHSGQDFGADTGTPVLAPITGTVVLAEPLQVRGKVVILDHGLGVFTGFWHLSKIQVEVGQVVGRGQVVGLVGNTGLSTGPHLHWEMRVHGVPVDPLQWTRRTFP
jgi:murein DD-endopeptidase MepM/ murein hydrolase activator NlpD